MNESTIRIGDTNVRVFKVSATDGVVDQQAFGLHEPHSRGRNWIAVINPNRAAPGGLEREFLSRARATFYQTAPVDPGDYLEVGADYFTGAGRRIPSRAYFRVLLVRKDTWVVRTVVKPPNDTLTIPPYTPEAEAAREALADRPPEAEPVLMSSS